MTSSKHDKFIQLCYTLAEEAVGNGDHPFGALLVRDCAVLQTAVNTVHSDNDETRHAEINLVTEAGRRFSPEELAQCTLYTSTEPCFEGYCSSRRKDEQVHTCTELTVRFTLSVNNRYA